MELERRGRELRYMGGSVGSGSGIPVAGQGTGFREIKGIAGRGCAQQAS